MVAEGALQPVVLEAPDVIEAEGQTKPDCVMNTIGLSAQALCAVY